MGVDADVSFDRVRVFSLCSHRSLAQRGDFELRVFLREETTSI